MTPIFPRWSCCRNTDKYAMGCTEVDESDEARTSRLSRNISNVSAMSPRMFRAKKRSSDNQDLDAESVGSYETLGRRSASQNAFLSDDEYTDDEL